jgi:IS30 family transposase
VPHLISDPENWPYRAIISGRWIQIKHQHPLSNYQVVLKFHAHSGDFTLRFLRRQPFGFKKRKQLLRLLKCVLFLTPTFYYRSLFIQARGVLKKELLDQLRSKRRMRRSRHASASGRSLGQIVDAISIRERPAEVEDRAIPGHWEGDLLRGAKNTYIATLVERHSGFQTPATKLQASVASTA